MEHPNEKNSGLLAMQPVAMVMPLTILSGRYIIVRKVEAAWEIHPTGSVKTSAGF